MKKITYDTNNYKIFNIKSQMYDTIKSKNNWRC